MRFDDRGELQSLAFRDGRHWAFDREGPIWRIDAGDGRKGELRFNLLGQFVGARTADGQVLTFGYDDVGLREATALSNGAFISYRYDGSGNLIHSGRGFPGKEVSSQYLTDAGNKIQSIVRSDGERYEFKYDDAGRLTESRRTNGMRTTYEYDQLSRFTAARFSDGALVQYTYGSGEADVATRLSTRLLPVYNQQREPNEFASRLEVRHSRVRHALLGIFTYDEVADELAFAVDVENWTPLSFVNDTVSALRLSSLLDSDVASFVIPSNRLFVPPEFWAVNCCYCPPCPSADCPPYSECEGCLPPNFPPPDPTPPPPTLCGVRASINWEAMLGLSSLLQAPYEQGFVMYCSSAGNGAIVFSDLLTSWTTTNDPCALSYAGLIQFPASVAAAHSHPMFTTAQQYKAGVSCLGDPRHISLVTPGFLRNVNRANENYSFGDRQFMTQPLAFVGLYMRTPDTRIFWGWWPGENPYTY